MPGEPTVPKGERDALLAFLDEAEAYLAEFNAWQASGGEPGADKANMDAALASLLSASSLVSQVATRMQSDVQSDWERLTWYEARAVADFSSAASALRAVARAHRGVSAASIAHPAEEAPMWAYALIGILAIGGGLTYIGYSARKAP